MDSLVNVIAMTIRFAGHSKIKYVLDKSVGVINPPREVLQSILEIINIIITKYYSTLTIRHDDV